MDSFANFRENVRAAMADRGLTVRAFAEMLGTSHSYIVNVLSGKIIPSLDKCDTIADKLGVPLERLIKKSKKPAAR